MPALRSAPDDDRRHLRNRGRPARVPFGYWSPSCYDWAYGVYAVPAPANLAWDTRQAKAGMYGVESLSRGGAHYVLPGRESVWANATATVTARFVARQA